jgi:hypothetical protein
MMPFTVRSLLACALSSTLVLLPALSASACGPDLPASEIFSMAHPDMPLKLFAAGKIGILPASYARSYLCVFYRYLTGAPLDRHEQESAVSLWHRRFERQQWFGGELDDPINHYLKLRTKVTGYNENEFSRTYSAAESYSYEHNIALDAYSRASSTLSERIKKFGLKSNEIKLWLKGQDLVFGIGGKPRGSMPEALPAASPLLLLQDRKYQIAAATLYQGNYAHAGELFAAIAADAQSPWHTLSKYLVVRCKCNGALNSDDPALLKGSIEFVRSALAAAQEPVQSQPLFDLLTPLLYKQLKGQQFLDYLVEGILAKRATRFGGDVGDLTFVMDEAEYNSKETSSQGSGKASGAQPEKLDFSRHDLTDWLSTIQQTTDLWIYDEKEKEQVKAKRADNARHALSVWHEKKTLPWLVAAMTGNGLRSDHDLFAAAEQVDPSSPAYFTARFYVLDALIAQGAREKSRRELLQLLSRRDLPPTTHNIFSAQLLSVATTAGEYLHSAMMAAPGQMYEIAVLPQNWHRKESGVTYSTEQVVFDDAVAEDLNRHLPLSGWLTLCRDKTIDRRLRGRIIRSTWVRAFLLGRADLTHELALPLAQAYPQLSGYVRAFSNAGAGEEQSFAGSRLILRNFGMTPYLDSGVERHGLPVGVFDDYNANFWLPVTVAEPKPKSDEDFRYRSVVSSGDNQLLALVRSCYTSGIRRLLSGAENAAATKERELIWSHQPSRFLGDIVFARAKSNPQDPDLPEMLYRIVRLPKWTENTPTGSQYSRQAYTLLHASYPKSIWARKATCWY